MDGFSLYMDAFTEWILSSHSGRKYISAQCYKLLLYLYCSEGFKFSASVMSSFKLSGPLQIPQDHCCRMTEQTEQKTKLTGRWEKCITGSRGDPNWCVGWIMHLSRSFQSCNFAKWQWSKLSLEGMVLRRRLKWLRECKRKHQRGERIFLSLVRFCHDLFYIYTFPLYPLAPILAIQIGLIIQCGNSCQGDAATIRTAHNCVLHSDG